MLRLEVGADVSLESERGKAMSRIMGWKTGAYLLMDAKDKRLTLKQGEKVVARTLCGGAYYGFSSEFLGPMPEIAALVFRYPENIIESSIGASARVAVVLPVSVSRTQAPTAMRLEGVITALGGTGFKMLCDMAFSPGDTAYVTGSLPTGKKLDSVSFTVVQAEERGNKFEVAGQFAGNETAEAAVAAYVEEIASYGAFPENIASPDGHGIPVGDTCHLHIGGYTQVPTVFRGVVGEKFILIDPPAHGAKPLLAARGAAMAIMYMAGGVAYRLETQMARHYTTPAQLWAVDFTGMTKKRGTRSCTRLNVFVPAALKSGDDVCYGVMLDLSEGGGCFATSCAGFYKGQRMTARLVLPDGGKVAGLECEVRNVDSGREKTLVGLSFDPGEGSGLVEIRRFCQYCMKLTS
ncbi:MAG: PilZ domain-containing protein [Nitrospinae bacterium]|nr:PilZ domain-containing protein [Nitrospinota bacterium]